MEFDQNKVDEATLALLWLVMEKDKDGVRAWKGFDWDTMNRLHEKGFISDPKGKAKSVAVTEEGEKLAGELFEKMFGLSS
jgi:DNA-binding PadR family transcriptional regulator